MIEFIPFSFLNFQFKQFFAFFILSFTNSNKFSIIAKKLLPSMFKKLNKTMKLFSALFRCIWPRSKKSKFIIGTELKILENIWKKWLWNNGIWKLISSHDCSNNPLLECWNLSYSIREILLPLIYQFGFLGIYLKVVLKRFFLKKRLHQN